MKRNKRIKIILIAGARPNFMKVAPVLKEINKVAAFKSLLIHTGQHYDREMSGIFFSDLEIRPAHIYLGVGSGTHAFQVAQVMLRLEDVLMKQRPGLVIVVGDVNSTLAASLVCAKLRIPLAHVEAGLRSFDRAMPEEINRIVTDKLSDYLFTTSRDAGCNLLREGIEKSKIFFVGNAMIDTLLLFQKKALELDTLGKFKLFPKNYSVLTLHRPENVDNRQAIKRIFQSVNQVSRYIPVIFPAHPRTKKMLKRFGLYKYVTSGNINMISSLGYLDFLNLLSRCRFVLTDSGGIQEEATVLNIPCLTLRRNTERPITLSQGTNILVGTDYTKILKEAKRILNGMQQTSRIPELWDGRAAVRIAETLKRILL